MAKENKAVDSANAESATESELNKALTLLEGAAQSTDDEKQTLLSKAMDGSISVEENDRLAALLGGKTDGPTIRDEVVKSLDVESDDRLQKALDVSEYLDGLHGGIVEALGTVADQMEKSDSRQHNFNVILAKGVRAIGELVKSVETRMETIEGQPVGGPRAARSPAQVTQLKKGFAGRGAEEDKLSKGEILDVLEAMNIESLEKGRDGQARCGEDLTKAVAKYESTLTISRPLLDELQQFRTKAAS